MPFPNHVLNCFPGFDQSLCLGSVSGEFRGVAKSLAFKPIFMQILDREPASTLHKRPVLFQCKLGTAFYAMRWFARLTRRFVENAQNSPDPTQNRIAEV